MATNRVSKKSRVRWTIAGLLMSGWFFHQPVGSVAAESWRSQIASLDEYQSLANFYVTHSERNLRPNSQVLNHLREHYAAAQAANNSRVESLRYCISNHRRDWIAVCNLDDISFAIKALSDFVKEARDVLKNENIILGRNMSLGKDILIHMGAVWVYERLRDFAIWAFCPQCIAGEELAQRLCGMLLPDWDDILLVRKRTVAYDWSPFVTTERLATLAGLRHNVTDDTEVMATVNTDRNLTNIFYIPAYLDRYLISIKP